MGSSTLWDAVELGRIIDGARIRRGYDRVTDLARAIETATGDKWSANTIYDVLNGRRLPSLGLLTALMLTLSLRSGDLTEALINPDARASWAGLCDSPPSGGRPGGLSV